MHKAARDVTRAAFFSRDQKKASANACPLTDMYEKNNYPICVARLEKFPSPAKLFST
jgi:hypothetical protein